MIRVNLILCLLFSSYAYGDLNTFKVTTRTAKAISKCAHYKVRGVCEWLVWKRLRPRISQTLYVDHYQPDLIVSVFPNYNKHPWKEMRVPQKLANKAGKAISRRILKNNLGYGQVQGVINNSNNIKFKEVSIIGNPIGSLPFPGVLKSQAKTLGLYYDSVSDCALWRSPKTEALLYAGQIALHTKEVGGGILYSWGPIYPRTGFLNQIDDAKTSAVLALRALNIATTSNPHISRNLVTNSCGKYCQGPGEIDNNSDTFFQMLYPIKDKSCGKLCSSMEPAWIEKARQSNGSYVWAVWRRYRGCNDGPGKRVACIKW